jgi:hypothetical protein
MGIAAYSAVALFPMKTRFKVGVIGVRERLLYTMSRHTASIHIYLWVLYKACCRRELCRLVSFVFLEVLEDDFPIELPLVPAKWLICWRQTHESWHMNTR